MRKHVGVEFSVKMKLSIRHGVIDKMSSKAQWKKKIATNEQRNISDFNYLCSFKDTLIPGDSGSPLTLKEVDGKWYLIAISVATLNYKWQSNLCDSNTINVKVDFFQTVVPDLAWILEIIHEM